MKNKYDLELVKRADFRFHESENMSIKISEGCIEIEFDDDNDDKRLSIKFKGFLGCNQTKIDCYDYNKFLRSEGRPRYMFEVNGSKWLKKINKTRVVNGTSDEMAHLGEPHHYLFAFGDDIVELIAYDNFVIKEIDSR